MERKTAAKELLTGLTEYVPDSSSLDSLSITTEEWEDLKTSLRPLLEGKTVDEYFGIVGGLFEEYDIRVEAGAEKEERIRLLRIESAVMSLGEEELNIDWN